VVQVQQGKVSRVRALDGVPLQRFYRLAMGSGQRRLIEAVQLRRILEIPIARLAAEHRTADDLLVLDDVLERMERSRGNAQEWMTVDKAFHLHLAHMTRNRLLVLQMQGLEQLVSQMMTRFNQFTERTGRNWDDTFARHRQIATAVISGDGPAAAHAMEIHFAAADRAVDEIYQDSQSAEGAGSPALKQ
jgi:GntR family transcriptional regulator, transcriptional repressor for pyruvate dehydrogenase complex